MACLLPYLPWPRVQAGFFFSHCALPIADMQKRNRNHDLHASSMSHSVEKKHTSPQDEESARLIYVLAQANKELLLQRNARMKEFLATEAAA